MNRLILAVCLIAIPLYAEEPAKPEAPMTKEYTQADKPIETAVGQQFTVKLVSNPSTGFGWQLTKPLDEKIVGLVTNTFVRKKTDKKLVGVGGHEFWTFKAVGQGQTEIAMKYVRPWEKDVPADKTNTFIVIVK